MGLRHPEPKALAIRICKSEGLPQSADNDVKQEQRFMNVEPTMTPIRPADVKA